MRFGSLFLFLSLPLSAQTFPSAAALLEENSRAFEHYHTVQFKADVTLEMTLQGVTRKVDTSSAVVAVAGPERYRVETKSDLAGASTFVSDGKQVWTYPAGLDKSW